MKRFEHVMRAAAVCIVALFLAAPTGGGAGHRTGTAPAATDAARTKRRIASSCRSTPTMRR